MGRASHILRQVLFWSWVGFTSAYVGLYLKLNDRVLGDLISHQVCKAERGQFLLRSVHYNFIGGYFSILLNTTVEAVGTDFTLIDPDGHTVLVAPRAETRAHLRELVASLIKMGVTGRFNLTLHFDEARIIEPWGVIAPTRSTWDKAKHEINIVASMSSRKPGGPPSVLHITVESLKLERARFAIAFPALDGTLSWAGQATELSAVGKLEYNSSKVLETPEGPHFFFALRDAWTPKSGTLWLGARQLPLDHLKVARFGTDGDQRGRLAFDFSVDTFGGAHGIGHGALTHVFEKNTGVELDLALTHLKEARTLLPSPVPRWLGGDPSGNLRVRGPFSAIELGGDVASVQANIEGIRVADVASRFRLDAESTLHLEDLHGKIGDGKVSGKLEIALAEPRWWHAALVLDRVDPGKVERIPPSVRAMLAGRLSGRFALSGSLDEHPEQIQIQDVDANLERALSDRLPKSIKVAGDVVWGRRLKFQRVRVFGDGVEVLATGDLDPRTETLAGAVEVTSGDATALARRLGAPTDLRVGRVTGRARLGGTLSHPTALGEIDVKHVHYVGRELTRLSADVELDGKRLNLPTLTVDAFGSTLSGDLSVGLGDGDPRLSGALGGRHVSLGQLLGTSHVTGGADLELSVGGTIRSPIGHAALSLETLNLYDDPYDNGRLVLDFDREGVTVKQAQLFRRHGGSITGGGRLSWKGQFELHVEPRNFPPAAIPGVSSLGIALDGRLSGDLRLDGDVNDPRPAGAISLEDFSFRRAMLGSGTLKFIPGGDAIAILGKFFDSFEIDGYLTLLPKFTVAATIKFKDLELERLFPEAKNIVEFQSKISGEARVSFDAQSGLSFAALKLSQVALTLQETDENGRPRNLVMRNQDDVLIQTDFHYVRFDRAQLYSPLGDFSVQGIVAEKNSDLRVRGQINLELLEYFFQSYFDHTHGDAYVDLTIRGARKKPELRGAFDLRKAILIPRGLEQRLFVPSGRIEITGDRVLLRNLNLQMDGAIAHASGAIALDRFSPTGLSGDISGELSARILQWILPDYFSDATGRVAVNVHVGGSWQRPEWQGKAEVRSVTVRPRRLGREILITEGTLAFVNFDLGVGCVPDLDTEGCRPLKARLDDDSTVELSGVVGLGDGFSVRRVDMSLQGSDLAYANQVLSVKISPRLRLTGDSREITMSGNIDVVEGRYFRKYDVQGFFGLTAARISEEDEPFWQGIPLLETMRLDLKTRSTGPLIIKNNIAELSLSETLDIKGTLSDPRIDGVVLLEPGGVVSHPLSRIPFVSTAGSVSFRSDKRIADGRLDIKAEGVLVDQSDRTHTIFLDVYGPISSPVLGLTSNSGWDRAATALAVVSGRTNEELRRLGTRDSGAASIGGGGAASTTEGIAKTATGALVGNIVSDPIRKLFGFDTTNIEFGTRSLDFRLCKRWGRMIKTCGEGQWGFASSSRLEGNGEFKLSDDVRILLRLMYLTQGVDTLDQTRARGRLELNYRIPLRF